VESSREITALRRENVAEGGRANNVAARERDGQETHAARLDFVWRLYPLVLVTLFPVALVSNFWLEV